MQEINPADYILVRDKDSNLYLTKQRILQEHNWEGQIRKLAKRKGYMSLISDFFDLKDLLDSRKRVYDGKGSLISPNGKKQFLDELCGLRNPWRAEYFGNRFFKYNDKWYMDSNFRVINGEITHLSRKEINPIMKDGWTSFKYFDEDGLVTKLKGHEIFVGQPMNNAVAGLGAGSDWAFLVCDWGPRGSGPAFGVREVRENFEI